MPALSADAADTIKLVRELNLLDEPSVRLLEQLFTNRLEAELITSLVHGKEDTVAVTLFRVCSLTHSAHILGYTLRFFADIVYADRSLGEQLGRADLVNRFGAKPAVLFLQFASQHEETRGVSNPALFLAATALRYGTYEGHEDAFRNFFAYARHAFAADSLQVSEVQFTVQACVQIARRKDYRYMFFEEGLVAYIPHLLTDIVSNDSAGIIQLIYDALLLTWLLSFEYEGIVQLVLEKMIPQLHRVLQRVQKEKCVRAALMALCNMVNAEQRYTQHMLNPTMREWVDNRIDLLGQLRCSDGSADQATAFRKGPSLIAEMVSIGMLKTLNQLCRRKFGDEDIGVLVQELSDTLESSMEVLTSFSEYRGEVMSKALDWTPVHTSTKFWKENATKFEDNNYEVLEALGKIILETHNDTTLAVACHDLGEVIRYHPTGRNLLTLPCMEGVKEKVMGLMSAQQPQIAKEALLCTQKIMVQRWEYIQQP